jgi:spore maturation protein A
LTNRLCNKLSFLINFLFPEIKNNKKIKKEISMNMMANILGLGNAATPLGIKAMESMQSENKNKTRLSNSMMTFILINTASIQLIPTTVIAIRKSLGSAEPTSIIVPVWCSTVFAAISGIIAVKIIQKIKE